MSDWNELSEIKVGSSNSETPAKAVANVTFADIGVMPQLCEACDKLGFKTPTEIQRESIPWALQGRDVIGLAQTGSGKTAAFSLPILQELWNNPSPLFACVMAPTRELAYQIAETIEALGSGIGAKCAVIVGGMDLITQQIALSKKPHIVVCTPGRLQDHLENTKGFSLRTLKYLVMDEADRLLDMDFGPKIDQILKVIPRERNTFLFSATMTTKVAKLQRASLSNPVKIEVSTKYSTVDKLLQYYMFFPFKRKDCYLVWLMNEMAGQSAIVFARTCNEVLRIGLLLRNLGIEAIPLHGQLAMDKRLGALNKFKSGARNVLVATDVASRGLDIPAVDLVVNFDIPSFSKDYIHRVGRTARAGRSGKAISFVTQYDVELLQRIEQVIGKKLDEFPGEKDAIMLLQERVNEAQRMATLELKEIQSSAKGKGKKRGRDDGDKQISLSEAKKLSKHGKHQKSNNSRRKMNGDSDMLYHELFGEASDDDLEFLDDFEEPIPGLVVYRNVQSAEQCLQYFSWLTSEYFPDTPSNTSNRRVNQGMHFGALTDPDTPLGQLCQICTTLSGLLPASVLARSVVFDQAIINLYDRGEGIGDHVDLLRFEDGVVGFSFGGSATMRMRKVGSGDMQRAATYTRELESEDPEEVTVRLNAGDVYAMSGEARYQWTHGIPKTSAGVDNVQSRRISVTLRKLAVQADQSQV
ncbi:ribosomal RNA processing protein [Coemansia pectinata]|uniref:Ribosomal RNA processing protein n=1 Tax=Coemansia pectinata TaxID=1052879 RepID=A0A9W8H433_9FUNG|nr:ribosomal RNA processing protein [Coemansia pectinata]